MTDVVIVAEPPPPPLSTANAVKGAVNAQSTTTGLVTIPDPWFTFVLARAGLGQDFFTWKVNKLFVGDDHTWPIAAVHIQTNMNDRPRTNDKNGWIQGSRNSNQGNDFLAHIFSIVFSSPDLLIAAKVVGKNSKFLCFEYEWNDIFKSWYLSGQRWPQNSRSTRLKSTAAPTFCPLINQPCYSPRNYH